MLFLPCLHREQSSADVWKVLVITLYLYCHDKVIHALYRGAGTSIQEIVVAPHSYSGGVLKVSFTLSTKPFLLKFYFREKKSFYKWHFPIDLNIGLCCPGYGVMRNNLKIILVLYCLLCQGLLMECSNIWKNTCCIFLGRIILLIFRPAVDTQLVWFEGWRLCREISASHRVWSNCVCDGATPGWFCSLRMLGCRAGFSSSNEMPL